MPPFNDLAPQTRCLDEGEALFQQGDEAIAIYWVEQGRLHLKRCTFDGRAVLIHTAHAGEFLAEASLFADSYHCDAVASEGSVVHVYSRAAVLNMIQSDPAVAMTLLATVARQLQKARQRLELRNVRSAAERLMLHLHLQADQDGRVTIAGDLQDIAAEVGLTREALYRTVAQLERSGHISRSGSSILIKKPLDV